MAPRAAFRDSPPFGTKWIFHKQMYAPWFLMAVHFWGTQNISVGLGLVLFVLCQYEDDRLQESTFIWLSGFVGNHLKTDHTCSLGRYTTGCLFVTALWVCTPARVCLGAFMCLMAYLCRSYVSMWLSQHAAAQAVKRPAIVICGYCLLLGSRRARACERACKCVCLS